jgi:hypothetical protein
MAHLWDKVAMAKTAKDFGSMNSAEAARRAMIAKLSKPVVITPPMRQGLLTKLRVADWPDGMPGEVGFFRHWD